MKDESQQNQHEPIPLSQYKPVIPPINKKCHVYNEGESIPQNIERQKCVKQKINVAMVSDFYYPFVGGVEIHIKQLATQLSKHQRIGKMIVITHKHDHHEGLKFMGVRNYHGFPVYYLNIHYNKQYMITYPTFVFNFKAAFKILKQEQIDIVHCHQSGSPLALEFIFFAKVLGLRIILTEHSLYGFRSLSDIHFNCTTGIFMRACDYIIGVSKTTKNNIILRAKVDKSKIVVIPNGVADVSHIARRRSQNKLLKKMNGKRVIKIICVGRMTYRRGTDLLIQILPQLCKQNDNIQIWIVGDGIKRKAMQKRIQNHELHFKVRLLGIISDHNELLQKMSQCDIFLNTPLTESFGIALAQAAMLGLFCVSTSVGGVDQAVPSHNLYTAKAQPNSLLLKLSEVIKMIREQQQNEAETDNRQKDGNSTYKYQWADVGRRTLQLYEHVMRKQVVNRKKYIIQVFKSGALLQIFFAFIAIILTIWHTLSFKR